MLQTVLAELYERDLGTLKAEIEKYENEADLWRVAGDIANSGGNLCLHIAGNLQHFFGAVLGGTGYVRDRDAEFARKEVPREELLREVDAALASVLATLEKLTDADLTKNYPIEVFGRPMTTEYFIVHLATHLTYHLGQINYHRRLISTKA
ncbi:MAG: DinB family protein [Pyrinomonadaceae bacterium]|nr:DinB family protein [Pyrinomonadaceae bacterium]